MEDPESLPASICVAIERGLEDQSLVLRNKSVLEKHAGDADGDDGGSGRDVGTGLNRSCLAQRLLDQMEEGERRQCDYDRQPGGLREVAVFSTVPENGRYRASTMIGKWTR